MIHASYLRLPRHAIDMRPQTRGVSRRKQIYVYYDTPHIWYRYEHIYEYRDTPHIYTDTPHIYTDTPRADFWEILLSPLQNWLRNNSQKSAE